MKISDFDFELPPELIAQHPLEKRDSARMLIVDRRRRTWRDGRFSEIPSELEPGDTLVVNDTRVFPARLVGRREPSGGVVELLLVRPLSSTENHIWNTLARPARRLGRSDRISFGNGRLSAEVLEVADNGSRIVRFDFEGDLYQLFDEIGQTPLPPYIRRDHRDDDDRERYQTIYAKARGAIAAPTAGLHFTDQVLENIRACGAQITNITLHVGYGTFAPVRVEDLSEHQVAPEAFDVSESAASQINLARRQGNRIVAIGTTTARALESSAAGEDDGAIAATRGEASLTITPGYRFRMVDALLTNFHLPRSSLLVLVGAFMGRELALAAYRHAIAERYRFYSYGDCMLII